MHHNLRLSMLRKQKINRRYIQMFIEQNVNPNFQIYSYKSWVQLGFVGMSSEPGQLTFLL